MSILAAFDHVGRRFADGPVALEDVSFTLQRGRTTALLGPSGCGKTTLLRLVAGLDEPDSGAIAFPAGRPRIGFVFQAPALMPWATVAQNAALPLTAGGQTDAAAVDRALARVGLADRADARPHELSGGMQMRVSIARALVSQPDLLLLDEPFAALDEISRHDLQELVAQLGAESGLTVALVTHAVSEAAFLADRVVIMAARPGRIARIEETPCPGPRDGAWRQAPAHAQRMALLSSLLRTASAP